MHFPISADFVLFSPPVDSTLVGVVNKVSPDHIGCLVYGLFNASIAADQFPKKEWVWDEDAHHWVVSGNVIQPGSIVKFKVAKLHTANDMMSIHGTFKSSSDCGLLQSEDIEAPPMALVTPAVETDDHDELESHMLAKGLSDPYADAEDGVVVDTEVEEVEVPIEQEAKKVKKLKKSIEIDQSETEETPKKKQKRIKTEEHVVKEDTTLPAVDKKQKKSKKTKTEDVIKEVAAPVSAVDKKEKKSKKTKVEEENVTSKKRKSVSNNEEGDATKKRPKKEKKAKKETNE
ncbi:hypothetical protein HDV02_001368 [Globomyces sp. JEL0801]|nr:hypothetical protein HDV02_001368 [Globomyces sp. JEL0801]